jgi:hypothetical protein
MDHTYYPYSSCLACSSSDSVSLPLDGRKGGSGESNCHQCFQQNAHPFTDRDDSSSTSQHLYRLDDLLYKCMTLLLIPTPTLYASARPRRCWSDKISHPTRIQVLGIH